MSDSGEKFAILRRGGIFIMYITSSRGVVSASPHFLWFRLGEGYGSKGTLFWMPVANQNSSIPDPKTWVEHNDRRLDLHLISDMYARKQTAAFKSPAASNAINECCLSLASAKTGKELNIECQSKQQRDQLFHEVYALITNEKSIEHFTSGSKRPATAQTSSSSSSSSSSQSRPATASVSSSSSSSHAHSKSSEMRPATAASPQHGAQRAPVQLQSSSSAHALNRPPSQNSDKSSPSSSPRVSSPPNGQGMPPLSSSSSSSSGSRSTPPSQLPPFPQILEILAKGTEFYLYALDPKRNVVRVRAFLFVKDGKGYGPSGTLFWGPLNSYTESNAYRLPLHTITEMSLRKQSAILRSSAASHAPEERCFALASPHIQINLEAHTSLVRDLWWKGILHKLQQTGKEILRTSLVPEQTELSTKPVSKGNNSKDGETGPYGTLIHHQQQQSSSSSSSSSNGKNIASKQPSSSPVSSAASISKPQHQDKSPRMDQTLLSLSDGHYFRKHDMEGAGLKHRVTNIILWTQGQGRHGTLYWAEGDKKVISPNKQLPLQSITDVLFRKQTPALLHCNAPDSYCFALVSDKMTLSLEADSADKCKSWLDGLARILTMAGKTVELQQSQGEKPVSAAQAAAQIKSGASVAQDKRPASAAKAPSAHDEISRTAQPHQQISQPTKLHTSPSEPTISRTDPTERFLLQLKLGEGSYGSVFRALDREDGKAVAIKVLQMDGSISGGLQREIQILQQCNSPYIVGYKGAFQKNDSVWIVMEYCAAGALTDIMKVIDRPLNEPEVATVVKMALHGLAYLHSVGKIHRDIKAGNILANHEGFCKLADFGVSGELNNTIGKQRTVIGTPHWMAPEVLTSDDYDEKADIWSLGITAYELAIGDPPHANLHSLRAAIKIPASPPPTLPDPHRWTNDFHSFIAACLVKDFTKRASAQQLLKHPFITKALPHTSLVELCHTSMEASEQKAEDFDPSEVLRNGNQPQRADVVSSTVRHPVSNNNIESTFEISEPQERGGSGTVVFGTIDSRDDSKISDTTLDFGTMMYKPAKAPDKKKDNYMAVSNDDRKADKGAKPSSSKSRSKHDDPEYESKPVKPKHKHKSRRARGDRDSSDDEYEQDFDDSPGNVKPDKKNPKNGKQASEGHYTFQISDFDHLGQK